MAIPLLYAGYLIATTAGRVAIPVIARYIIKKGVKKAIVKYGAKVISNAKVVKSVKNVKARSKVKFVAKTAKAKNIAAKVKAKDRTVRGKSKPKPIVKTKPKVTSKSKPKTINPRTKPKPIVKTKPKVTSKSKPKEIVSRTKPKPTKVKPVTKATKPKPRTKPKPVSPKSKPKPITKPVKTAKPKVKPKSKTKPVKPVSKPKPVVKGKPKSILPIIVGGGLGLAGVIAGLSKKDKGNNITIKRKDKPSPDPKKSIGGTGRGEGALEFARRSKDAAVKKIKAQQSLDDRKLYNNRMDTYESRIRALVKQKDKLTKIQSGDGRNEYQVRINKLKKENPKEFKKLFKLGGFGNLKD